MSKLAVIIVAGGSGTRMGSSIPKQFIYLNGLPLLMHTINRFERFSNHIIVVLPEVHMGYWRELCQKEGFSVKHTVVAGGQSRFQSVKNGLSEVGDADLVAVHDGVRPIVSHKLIETLIEDGRSLGAVIPVVTPVDSMREVDVEQGNHIVNRRDYRMVQTPQLFHRNLIVNAYKQPEQEWFTDDASVVEASGATVFLSEGSSTNIKITNVSDLIIASALLSELHKQDIKYDGSTI